MWVGSAAPGRRDPARPHSGPALSRPLIRSSRLSVMALSRKISENYHRV